MGFMFNLGKKYTMSRFKYPIPEIIRPLLIVKNITSVEKLIDYVEKHPMKFVPSMYADFLWKNDVEKEVFFFFIILNIIKIKLNKRRNQNFIFFR